jgi:hypothetical protein
LSISYGDFRTFTTSHSIINGAVVITTLRIVVHSVAAPLRDPREALSGAATCQTC